MKINKVLTSTVLAIALVATTTANVGFAKEINFTDVSENAWYYNTLQWGADNNMVGGYPNNTFRPNNSVSEAEFVKLLISAYQPDLEAGAGESHWADRYYKVAKANNYPVTSNRSRAVNRGWVAELIASADGQGLAGDKAVEYLLGKGLANGKVPGDKTVGNYKAGDALTRAEAVQFIRNAKEKGLDTLKKRPAVVNPPVSGMPADLKQAYDNLVRDVAGKYPDYQLLSSGTGVSFDNGNQGLVASVTYDTTLKRIGSIVLWENTSDTNVKLAVDMLKASGVDTTDSAKLTKALKDAQDVMKEAVNTTINMGGHEIVVSPHPVNAEVVFIIIKN